MSECRYTIEFNGKIIPGWETEEVKANLAKLLKAGESTLERLFSGKRFVIKKNVDQKNAFKINEAFKNAGADLIHGGNGRDIIEGGSGSDELHGDFGWNTYKDQKDGSKDLIAIKSDQHLSNFWYGKAGNSPNGEKADFIEGLDATDEIKIIGVATKDLGFKDEITAKGVSGIGIYAKGALEAVYTGGNLSLNQISQMTSGDASAAAMANQMWSYWGNNTAPALQA